MKELKARELTDEETAEIKSVFSNEFAEKVISPDGFFSLFKVCVLRNNIYT